MRSGAASGASGASVDANTQMNPGKERMRRARKDGVLGQKDLAVVRVFEMLIERMGRLEDSVSRVSAYLGQRAEELPRGSEFGAELGAGEDEGPSAGDLSLRLIKSYDGRFDRAADLFLVDAPFAAVKTGEARVHTPEWARGDYRVWEDQHVEATLGLERVQQIRARVLEATRDEDGFVQVSTELVGLEGGAYDEQLGCFWRRKALKHLFPEVIAVEGTMLVDLSRGPASERMHRMHQMPLQQLYRVVQRVKSELEKGHGGSREPEASEAFEAFEVHTVPRYAGGVATALIEGCIEDAAAECQDSKDPRVADFCRRMHGASGSHPMGSVWDAVLYAWSRALSVP